MSADLEPVVFDQPSGRERGEAHGELWRQEIAELAAIRMDLCVRNTDRKQALALAGRHLPLLHDHDPELHDELVGISRGANLDVEQVLVLNQHTALHVTSGGPVDDPGGATAIYTHGEDGPLLGQTLDMHAGAERFVRIIAIRSPGRRQETLCFTVTGCLGIAGLGHAGVALTTNHLSCTDVKVGLAWPALVRQLLDAPDADAALARLRAAPRGSGHHFMIADGQRFYGVECSGQLDVLTQKGARAAHLHTNHCFDPVLRQRERVPPQSSTFARLNMATTLYAQQRPTTLEALWDLLGSHEGFPRSICSHAGDADSAASVTCGRIVMRPLAGTMRVSRGCSRTGPVLDLVLRG